jgi:hypothetical protein
MKLFFYTNFLTSLYISFSIFSINLIYNLGVIISFSYKSFITFSSNLRSDLFANCDSIALIVALWDENNLILFSSAILLKLEYRVITSSNISFSNQKSISAKTLSSFITFLVIITLALFLI